MTIIAKNESDLDAIQRLSRDLKAASVTLSPNEARYLVDAYYTIQEYRKTADNQVRALSAGNEPHSVIGWLSAQTTTLESQIQRALDAWSDSQEIGRWAKSIVGIGPVIASGLMANIDINKATTVGKIWRFAGYDPNVIWEKGQKRPWNADLKVLLWKVGESFVKVSSNKNDYYGKLYLKRKEYEWNRNLNGQCSEAADKGLLGKNFGEEKLTPRWYRGEFDPTVVRHFLTEGKPMLELPKAEAGKGVKMIPPAQVHARAKRWAVKLFVSHYHEVLWRITFQTEPPKPWGIANMPEIHTHYIPPPNWPMGGK